MKKYEKILIFRVNSSSLLLYGLIVFHALAIVAVALTGLLISIQILLDFVIIVSLYFYSQKEFYNKNGIRLRYSSSYGWAISINNSEFIPLTLLPSTVISSYLLVLHFKTDKSKKKTIFIVSDSMNKTDFRKLLVTLKITGLSDTEI